MASPQISVIIPAFNAADYLPRALDSALSQTGVSLEIIIVNNNSTDETIELAQDYIRQYPDKIRLGQELKVGAAAARNCGLKMARAEWVQFLDADDLLLPGKLNRQLNLVNAATDWVIGAFIRRDLHGKETSTLPHPDPWKGLVHNGGTGHTNSNLIRREKLLELGGQNEDLPNGEDNDLYFRLLKHGATYVQDEVPGAVYIDRQGFRLSEDHHADPLGRAARLIYEVVMYLEKELPDYFLQNSAFYYSALLNGIRQMAVRDLKGAKKMVDECFPLSVNSYFFDHSILPPSIYLYKWFGFYRSEMILRGVRKTIPDGIRIGLKSILSGK